MTDYELAVLEDIKKWKNPRQSNVSKAVKFVSKPFEKVGDIILDNKVGEAVNKAIHGIISIINDVSTWTVRDDAIFEEFRKKGYADIYAHEDIFKLDLEKVDNIVGYLGAKYKITAATEGAVTGIAGAAGIFADIPLLFGIVLRAIGEHATYYGFNMQSQSERAYALNILMLSSATSLAAKQVAMAELRKISVAVAKKKTWEEIEKILAASSIKKIAESLGIRMTKGKLGQVVPVIGSVIGGGYNAYFTSRACEAAYHLYRERFITHRNNIIIDL